MKNKKQSGKKSKAKSNLKDQTAFIGKRRKRELNDIIINKYDIYSLLEDINYDQAIKIPKRSSDCINTENVTKMSLQNKEVENIIKSEKSEYNIYMNGVSDTGCGATDLNENIIKTEDSPDCIKSDNTYLFPRQSLLKLILSDTQLLQFTEIFKIFSKEIESPFTLDYFMKLKEKLKNEEKDKIINSLLFLVWSLKFMKIDYLPSVIRTIEHQSSFSFFQSNQNISYDQCKSPTFFNGDNHSNSFIPHFNSNKCICNHYSSNISETITPDSINIIRNTYRNHDFNRHHCNLSNNNSLSEIIRNNNIECPLNCFDSSPFTTLSGNYIIPLNLIPGISLSNPFSYSVTNPNINDNESVNRATNINNIDNTITAKSIMISNEVIHDSFCESNNTIDSLVNNCGNTISNDSSKNKNNQISFSANIAVNDTEKESCNKDLNFFNVKKEESYMDISLADENVTDENLDKIYSEVIKIFSKPITDESFKLLKVYLLDENVKKVEKIIKKNPFSYLNKKQYVLLCKKDKEGLYLKIDPGTKNYSITRCFYKSHK